MSTPADGLKLFGEIAAPAGLTVAVFFYLGRDVIAAKFLPILTKQHAYQLLQSIIVGAILIAVSGLGSYTYVKTRPPVTIPISHAQYEAFLRDMQALIDAPTMPDAQPPGAKFNDGFSMFKAVLSSDEERELAQGAYEVIRCAVHRRLNVDADTQKVVDSCNARKIATDVNPAKHRLGELFGALPFRD